MVAQEMMRFLEWVQFHVLIREVQPHNYLRYLLLYKRRFLPIETTPSGKMLVFKEEEYRKQNYVPKDGLVGKTVLDVGAGAGETAWFFFMRGASKVICVEPDPKKLALLRTNARKLDWNVEIIPERFSLEHMQRDFDYAKIDCEGGEDILLSLSPLALPRMSIEIHYRELAAKFAVKFPEMKITKKFHWPFNTWMGKID